MIFIDLLYGSYIDDLCAVQVGTAWNAAELRPPRRVHQTAFSQVAATPAASRVTSAPTPPVTCSADHKGPCFAKQEKGVTGCLETRGPEHP